MERQINDAIRDYMIGFKSEIIQKRKTLDIDSFNVFVAEKEPLKLCLQDFQAPSKIPHSNRCLANRTNGEQCTRKRQQGKNYCGTHSKTNETTAEQPAPNLHVEVYLENFDGIFYYIDKVGNVYKTEDIQKENICPFAKYTCHEGKFKFVT